MSDLLPTELAADLAAMVTTIFSESSHPRLCDFGSAAAAKGTADMEVETGGAEERECAGGERQDTCAEAEAAAAGVPDPEEEEEEGES